jgi:hypothetical protein
MKLLLDENQVGVITGGNNPSAQVFNSVANGFDHENGRSFFDMVPINGLPQPQQGDTPVVGFPNIRTCQGVVCVLKDGTMVATHVPLAVDEPRLLAKMKEIIGDREIATMYVASRDRSQTHETGLTPEEKAQLLGFTGKLRTFDTGKASKQNQGIYVEFTPAGHEGKCLVEYKKDKKMSYSDSILSTTDNNQRVRTAVAKHDSRLYDESNATKLHKASVKSRTVK